MSEPRNPKTGVDAYMRLAPNTIQANEAADLRRRKLDACWEHAEGQPQAICRRCLRQPRVRSEFYAKGFGFFIHCRRHGPLSRMFPTRQAALDYWDGDRA